jgi:hypothetical protein
VSHRCKTDWYRLNALKLSSATLACARAAPFEIACPEWVKRVILAVRRSLPVLPDKRTISEPVGTSRKRLTFDAGNQRRNQPLRLAHLDHGDDCAILLESGEGSARVKTKMLRHG